MAGTSDDHGRQQFCASPGPCRYQPAGKESRNQLLSCCQSGIDKAVTQAAADSDIDRLAELLGYVS